MTYTLNIVTHNSDTFLDDVLRHCWRLTDPPLSIIIVDNASSDRTLSIISTHQREHPELTLLRNAGNLGFSKAHNQGIALSARKNADAIFLLNPDVLLEPECSGALLHALAQDEHLGSVSPMLYRLQSEHRERRIIDSAGLQIRSSLRVVDRGSGEEDRSQFMSSIMFGGSAAAILYRRVALEDIAEHDEVFDDRFFAYKEDVDVAFRLHSRGWSHWFCAEAVGFHYRCHRSGALWSTLRQRKHRSDRTRQSSYRNHVWVLVKNIPLAIFIRQGAWIVLVELLQFVYFLFTEPKTTIAMVQAIAHMPTMLKKRKRVLQRSIDLSPRLRRWIVSGI